MFLPGASSSSSSAITPGSAHTITDTGSKPALRVLGPPEPSWPPQSCLHTQPLLLPHAPQVPPLRVAPPGTESWHLPEWGEHYWTPAWESLCFKLCCHEILKWTAYISWKILLYHQLNCTDRKTRYFYDNSSRIFPLACHNRSHQLRSSRGTDRPTPSLRQGPPAAVILFLNPQKPHTFPCDERIWRRQNSLPSQGVSPWAIRRSPAALIYICFRLF